MEIDHLRLARKSIEYGHPPKLGRCKPNSLSLNTCRNRIGKSGEVLLYWGQCPYPDDFPDTGLHRGFVCAECWLSNWKYWTGKEF